MSPLQCLPVTASSGVPLVPTTSYAHVMFVGALAVRETDDVQGAVEAELDYGHAVPILLGARRVEELASATIVDGPFDV